MKSDAQQFFQTGVKWSWLGWLRWVVVAVGTLVVILACLLFVLVLVPLLAVFYLVRAIRRLLEPQRRFGWRPPAKIDFGPDATGKDLT